MVMLDKKGLFFDRDEKEQLIPQKVTLYEKGKTKEPIEAMITPMTRGESKRLLMKASFFTEPEDLIKHSLDQDKQIILEHVKHPLFTPEEIDNLKPWIINLLTSAVIKASGLQREVNDDGEETGRVMQKN